jgi:hypothetical protein
MDFSIDILVEAPVEVAFGACDSAKDQISWIASLIEVRLDEQRPWGVGSTFVQIHEEDGRRQEFHGELLAYEPERRIGTRLVHADFELESQMLFEDLGPRCQIRQETSLKVRSLMLKAMRPMIAKAVEARLRQDFERLKVLVESRA